MNELRLNRLQAEKFKKACFPFLGCVTTSKHLHNSLRQTTLSTLPLELLEALDDLRTRNTETPTLLIRNLGFEEDVPPTPSGMENLPAAELTLVAEAMALGFALLMGEPTAYKEEKLGALIQHVIPIQSEELAPSNESSLASLDLHTELAFLRDKPTLPLSQNSPDFLILLCSRPGPFADASTLIVNARTLSEHIPRHYLSILRQPRFMLQAPYSFTRDDPTDRPWIGPSPLFGGSIENPTAAFDLACGTKAIDADAERALDALKDAATAQNSISRLNLRSGDLLIIDNRRCLHGRSPFKATYDGNDRWLQRIYVRLSQNAAVG